MIDKKLVKELLDKDIIETIITNHRKSLRVMDICIIEVYVMAADDTKNKIYMSVSRRSNDYTFMSAVDLLNFKETKFPYMLYDVDEYRESELIKEDERWFF